VLDFDGTITEEDMLDLVCRYFGDPDVYREVDAALARGDIRLVDDIERKLATVRRPLEDVVYVGDGWSDRCVALVAPRVFARDGLARYLDEHGVAYEPFADLHDVARALDGRRAAA